MCDKHELLNQLAEEAGVETGYYDVYGVYHEAPPETKQALLAAMGWPATTPEEQAESLHRLGVERWQEMLEPVTVHRHRHGLTRVQVTLPTHRLKRRLHWKVTTESGPVYTGEVVPSDLDPLTSETFDGVDYVTLSLPLAESLPEGYHYLRIDIEGCAAESHVIIAPSHGYRPDWIDRGEHLWGLGCHLYSVRSENDWGIGDFTSLERLGDVARDLGASIIGINPLHALFPAKPEDASPYSPASRLFLNTLYLDVTAVPDFATCDAAQRLVASEDFQRTLSLAKNAEDVDYRRVAGMKMRLFELLHDDFEVRHPPGAWTDPRRSAFEAFKGQEGEPLYRFGLFRALHEHFGGKSWHVWPKAFQRPDSPEVAAFAKAYARRIDYYCYLQWLVEEQLGAVSRRLQEDGLAVGLYRDLAVGVSADGADIWLDQSLYALEARFGAPPDALAPLGQDWGMPPMNPHQLRKRAYAPLIAMLRANMRHAGALRIDHAIALKHLFWIPPGQTAERGCYVRYPYEDFLGILALESKRAQCILIGEDLGTVPVGFRERAALEHLLSYRVFFFERWPTGLLKRPDAYPAASIAVANTHDMPTIAGYWRGHDLDLRRSLGLFPSDEALEDAEAERPKDLAIIAAALCDQGLLSPEEDYSGALDDEKIKHLIKAIHLFLARTPAWLMMVALDDLLLEERQLNVPGTTDEYPNWRRKLSRCIEGLAQEPFTRETAQSLTMERQHLSEQLRAAAAAPKKQAVGGKP